MNGIAYIQKCISLFLNNKINFYLTLNEHILNMSSRRGRYSPTEWRSVTRAVHHIKIFNGFFSNIQAEFLTCAHRGSAWPPLPNVVQYCEGSMVWSI